MLGTRAGWIAKTRVSTFGGIHSKLIHFPGVNVKVSGCAGICNTEPHSPAQRKRVVTIKKKNSFPLPRSPQGASDARDEEHKRKTRIKPDA